MKRKIRLDQPVMARAIGRPSPSTASHRCQARVPLMKRRSVCDPSPSSRAGVGVDIKRPLRHRERHRGISRGGLRDGGWRELGMLPCRVSRIASTGRRGAPGLGGTDRNRCRTRPQLPLVGQQRAGHRHHENHDAGGDASDEVRPEDKGPQFHQRRLARAPGMGIRDVETETESHNQREFMSDQNGRQESNAGGRRAPVSGSSAGRNSRDGRARNIRPCEPGRGAAATSPSGGFDEL